MNTPNVQHPIALQFESTTFNVVERDNEPWLRGQQVADALGYQNHRQAIDDLYKRNASEFSADMTALVKLPDLRQQSADSGLHPQNGGAGQTRTVRELAGHLGALARLAVSRPTVGKHRRPLVVTVGHAQAVQATTQQQG